MLDDTQMEIWEVLSGLDGETVACLLTDYHGTYLLDEGFRDFLVEEGYIDETEEPEDDDSWVI